MSDATRTVPDLVADGEGDTVRADPVEDARHAYQGWLHECERNRKLEQDCDQYARDCHAMRDIVETIIARSRWDADDIRTYAELKLGQIDRGVRGE